MGFSHSSSQNYRHLLVTYAFWQDKQAISHILKIKQRKITKKQITKKKLSFYVESQKKKHKIAI